MFRNNAKRRTLCRFLFSNEFLNLWLWMRTDTISVWTKRNSIEYFTSSDCTTCTNIWSSFYEHLQGVDPDTKRRKKTIDMQQRSFRLKFKWKERFNKDFSLIFRVYVTVKKKSNIWNQRYAMFEIISNRVFSLRTIVGRVAAMILAEFHHKQSKTSNYFFFSFHFIDHIKIIITKKTRFISIESWPKSSIIDWCWIL